MNTDYEMFGLDPNDTSLKAAKKAYYNIALLVHPDRNTCPDKNVAHDEMQAVTDAYNRICLDIQTNKERCLILDSDDLKETHKKAMNSLDQFTKDMPCFMDIYIETHDDMKKFNAAWDKKLAQDENCQDYFLNTDKGYDIQASEYAGNNFDIKYDPNIKIDEYVFDSQITEDLIPIENVGGELALFDNNLNVSDYHQAFYNSVPFEKQLPKNIIDKYDNLSDIDLLLQNKQEEFNTENNIRKSE